MTPEPTWPTPAQESTRPGSDQPLYARGYNQAIKDCQRAWRLANDDPSKSLVGEVRRSPKGLIYARFVPKVVSYPSLPWVRFQDSADDSHSAVVDAYVHGWPVIGAVPGTPAAEATR